jgi:hypothetical protein
MPAYEPDNVAGGQRLELDRTMAEPLNQEQTDHAPPGGHSRLLEPSFLRQMLSELAYYLSGRVSIDGSWNRRQYAHVTQVLQEPPQPGAIVPRPLTASAPGSQEFREPHLG